MKCLRIIVMTILLCLSYGCRAAYIIKHYSDADEHSLMHPTKILQDRSGMIWIGTWNGLVRFDGYSFVSFKAKAGDGSGITSDRVRNIMIGDGDNLVCRIDDKVYIFNTRTCQFCKIPDDRQLQYIKRFDTQEQIFHDPITATYNDQTITGIRQDFVDRQSNHWLMLNTALYMVGQQLGHGTTLGGIPQETIRCIFRDSKGQIWVCCRDSKLVAVYDNKLKLKGFLGTDGTLHSQPTAFAPIYRIYEDKTGTIWLTGKPSALFKLSPQGTIQSIDLSSLPSTCEGIYDVLVDKRGRTIIATQKAGIYLLDTGKLIPAAFKGMHIRRMMLCADGTLLCTSTDGLAVVDDIYANIGKWTTRLHTREADRVESLSCSATMDMVMDNRGILYVSTESGGINELLTKDLHSSTFEFRHHNIATGFDADIINSLAILDKDHIFVQGANQICILNTSDGSSVNYGQSFWGYDTHFSDSEPLILPDGAILLSMNNGVKVLKRSDLSLIGFKPRIALTSITMSNDLPDYAVDSKDTVRLSPSQRSLTITFAALDYRDNTKILYRVRMSEDSPWSSPMSAHEMMLQDLDPGEYTFQVCSTNAEGQWIDNTRTLHIIVEPTFLESWWGRTIIVLIILIIAAVITYGTLHIRRLKRERRETLEAYLALLDKNSETKETGGETTEVKTESPEISEKRTLSHEDQAFMQRLMTYIEENISNADASVLGMAEATATSRSSLNRKMHQLLGITPADFLKEARIKHACKLLQTSDSIADVAYKCGFSDPKYFTKVFKSSVGMSPKEYSKSNC